MKPAKRNTSKKLSVAAAWREALAEADEPFMQDASTMTYTPEDRSEEVELLRRHNRNLTNRLVAILEHYTRTMKENHRLRSRIYSLERPRKSVKHKARNARVPDDIRPLSKRDM